MTNLEDIRLKTYINTKYIYIKFPKQYTLKQICLLCSFNKNAIVYN